VLEYWQRCRGHNFKIASMTAFSCFFPFVFLPVEDCAFFGASVLRLPLFGVMAGYAYPTIVSSSKAMEIEETESSTPYEKPLPRKGSTVRNVHGVMGCNGIVEAQERYHLKSSLSCRSEPFSHLTILLEYVDWARVVDPPVFYK